MTHRARAPGSLSTSRRVAPDDCADMATLRVQIDGLDAELVRLLVERMGYIDRAITLKRDAGIPARVETRVAQVIAHVRHAAQEAGLDPDLVEAVWRQIIEWSIAREAAQISPPTGIIT